jgi:hypothetical protein
MKEDSIDMQKKLNKIITLVDEMKKANITIDMLSNGFTRAELDKIVNATGDEDLTYENIVESTRSDKRKTYDDEVDKAYANYRYALKYLEIQCKDTIRDEETRALEAVKIYMDGKTVIEYEKLEEEKEAAANTYKNVVELARDKFYSRQ